MNKLKLIMCGGAASIALACAGAAVAQTAPAPAAAPAANPMPYPAMTAPMTANPAPAVFDAGPVGKIMVDGVLSGLALYQSPTQVDVNGNDHEGSGIADLANAQVIINKTDGLFQFYLEGGAYSLPTLGSNYYRTETIDQDTFGILPVGFVKIVPNSNFNIMVGALPTLIGGEYTFTFQNMNIERGLLWAQEPVFSKGIQANYTKGPIALSLAWTDGYWSNDFTSLSGLATYTFKNGDTLAFAGEGSLSDIHLRTFPFVDTLRTPPPQANGQVYNLLFSHTQGPWTISPYIQFTSTPLVTGKFHSILSNTGETWGVAVLTKYSFTPVWSLSGRVEYIDSSGKQSLLYGINSNAWSFTITPSYQQGVFFARGELSYVTIGSGTPGAEFGKNGNSSSQTRVLVDPGVVF